MKAILCAQYCQPDDLVLADIPDPVAEPGDRQTGQALFEARASSEGSGGSGARALAAMFDAAMMDFPRLGLNPRRVVMTLPE